MIRNGQSSDFERKKVHRLLKKREGVFGRVNVRTPSRKGIAVMLRCNSLQHNEHDCKRRTLRREHMFLPLAAITPVSES